MSEESSSALPTLSDSTSIVSSVSDNGANFAAKEEEEEETPFFSQNKLQNMFSSSETRQLLQHEASIVRHSENLSNFLRFLSLQLNVNEEDEEEMMKQIKERVSELLRQQSQTNSTIAASNSSESVGYLLQRKQLYEQRIKEQEEEIKDAHKLLNIMQKELESTKHINSSVVKQKESLELIVHKFSTAAGFSSNYEEALKHIKETKERCVFLEEYQKDHSVEDMMAHLHQQQIEALSEIQATIDMQSKLISQYQRQIENSARINTKEEMMKDLCNSIEATNEKLQRRIKQLKNVDDGIKTDDNFGFVVKDTQRKAMTPQSIRRKPSIIPKSECDNEMKHCIWMAKTREMLALERKMNRMDEELHHSSNKMRFLTQENIIQHQKLEDGFLNQNLSVIYPGTIL